MKSTVIVQAHHGWPIDVTPIDLATGEGDVTRVARNTERTFHVASGHDLRVHEVSPLEEAAEPNEDPSDAR